VKKWLSVVFDRISPDSPGQKTNWELMEVNLQLRSAVMLVA